jgi:hypothetical protein
MLLKKLVRHNKINLRLFSTGKKYPDPSDMPRELIDMHIVDSLSKRE